MAPELLAEDVDAAALSRVCARAFIGPFIVRAETPDLGLDRPFVEPRLTSLLTQPGRRLKSDPAIRAIRHDPFA
jgi:hypothetical protein